MSNQCPHRPVWAGHSLREIIGIVFHWRRFYRAGMSKTVDRMPAKSDGPGRGFGKIEGAPLVCFMAKSPQVEDVETEQL